MGVLHTAVGATQNVDNQAGCWDTISSHVRLWRCSAQGLPLTAQQHTAAKLQSLVVNTRNAWWVIDPGATAQQGRLLNKALQTLAANNHPRPALYVVNSRAQAEHVMASDAFVQRWTGKKQTLAFEETARLMKQRCIPCRQRLERELGTVATHGTRIRIPDRITQQTPRPPFQLQEEKQTAIESDTWAFSEDGTWIWTGVMLMSGVPDLASGLVDRRIGLLNRWVQHQQQHPNAVWMNALGRLDATTVQHNLAYFEQYEQAANLALDSGANTLEALDQLRAMVSPIALTTLADRQTHDLNLQRIVRQREDALLGGTR